MGEIIQQTSVVPEDFGGRRFDQIAVDSFPDFSRSKLQAWIKLGVLQVDGKSCKPKDRLVGGERLCLNVEIEERKRWGQEYIPLDIVYEDEDILVINKSSGLVVHPAAGNYSGTLLNGLLYHCHKLASLPRAGIVHRLDKDTSGLMVVAKTLAAHTDLVTQLQERSIDREYEAVAQGVMTGGGVVNQPIGRHRVHRIKNAVVSSGKQSITHYRVIKRYRAHTHVRLKLETGRTHQIRVHMAHICYPLVGDQLYGGGLKLPKACEFELKEQLQKFRRQALHARRLGLIHPVNNEFIEWQAPLPDDFQHLLEALSGDQENKNEV
ncbi:MAG: 23S rRNA pseudouridine(1911/1915/1917) synthase RluD [Candidatus Endonucleobacter bathymodioli]|uniref:Pseudouridine synthase n=1 Tax=Candidatus Endonucleibacter bathymodioli TaxID=539814 RepID=A0AA90SSX9_9GAMM|nr:23S rRNA pseudouridine(1911/1915/1917) synthase RluD [Candidatus Endonucleobacter bathymodioli]